MRACVRVCVCVVYMWPVCMWLVIICINHQKKSNPFPPYRPPPPRQSFDDEGKAGLTKKFFKDLAQMMEGMTDLVRRGQMPDKERGICVQVRVGVKVGVRVRVGVSACRCAA